MKFLDSLFKILGDPGKIPGAQPQTLPLDGKLHREDFKVIGMNYHPQSFARLQQANPDWRKSKKAILDSELVTKPIFHYSYVNKPVDLRPDLSGQFGKDRIMVFIEGEHVGYLPEDDDIHVGEILRFASIKYITAVISGGEYRVVFRDGTEQKGKDPLSVSVRVGYSVF